MYVWNLWEYGEYGQVSPSAGGPVDEIEGYKARENPRPARYETAQAGQSAPAPRRPTPKNSRRLDELSYPGQSAPATPTVCALKIAISPHRPLSLAVIYRCPARHGTCLYGASYYYVCSVRGESRSITRLQAQSPPPCPIAGNERDRKKGRKQPDARGSVADLAPKPEIRR
uniref:Uncharacterized protein n=1 Tax=Coccidioides posadasii RMSCC 3488 TaxID=454284 RepID=A0A0J6F695_COCPO|nr:hypothetical protein CPAG_00826 [Coccidioides posadasii RMSCC 3488]